MAFRALFLSLLAVALCGCPPPPPGGDAGPPIVPAEYDTWTEVRDCRRSPDHDLAYIRVVASPTAEPIYTSRMGTFPDGALLVKLEYADPDCTDLSGLTAMQWMGSDWIWQELDARRVPMVTDTARCAGCHAECGLPPDGFEGTCALP